MNLALNERCATTISMGISGGGTDHLLRNFTIRSQNDEEEGGSDEDDQINKSSIP